MGMKMVFGVPRLAMYASIVFEEPWRTAGVMRRTYLGHHGEALLAYC